MFTLEIAPELAERLAAEARRRGTTPELLALEGVRRMLPPIVPDTTGPGTMLDMLEGLVGIISSKGSRPADIERRVKGESPEPSGAKP